MTPNTFKLYKSKLLELYLLHLLKEENNTKLNGKNLLFSLLVTKLDNLTSLKENCHLQQNCK